MPSDVETPVRNLTIEEIIANLTKAVKLGNLNEPAIAALAARANPSGPDNNADAQYLYADLWHGAYGHRHVNKAKALEYIRLAAGKDHLLAKAQLGLWLYTGLGAPLDTEVPLTLLTDNLAKLEAEAEKPDRPYAKQILGQMYADGFGVKKDLKKAEALLEEAVQAGLPVAATALARVLRNKNPWFAGAKATRDRRVKELLLGACNQNYVYALNQLASYLNKTPDQDKEAVLTAYRMADHQGHEPATRNLIDLLLELAHVNPPSRNEERAAHELQKQIYLMEAIEKLELPIFSEEASANYHLGCSLLELTDPDYPKAKAAFLKATKLGNATAPARLALLDLSHDAGPTNAGEAFILYAQLLCRRWSGNQATIAASFHSVAEQEISALAHHATALRHHPARIQLLDGSILEAISPTNPLAEGLISQAAAFMQHMRSLCLGRASRSADAPTDQVPRIRELLQSTETQFDNTSPILLFADGSRLISKPAPAGPGYG